jgi:hypothetical protein
MEENKKKIELNEVAVDALRVSAKWSLFLAIMGFIGIGFMIIAAIFISSIMGELPDNGNPVLALKGFIGVIYIVLAALYFPPVYYLFKYATDMKTALQNQDSTEVGDALNYLKSHHRYLGISIIVVISLYFLMIIGVVITSIMAASKGF